MKKNTTKVKAVPCEVYSRVVGYFRPVSNWNAGKQVEFEERRNVNLNKFLQRQRRECLKMRRKK